MTNIYTSGDYLSNNPNWHEEDSAWKAQQILKIIQKNNIHPRSISEVGCGTGKILQELQPSFPKVGFTGYDISPQAIQKAMERENDHLHFHALDILTHPINCDLMLCIDVIEHIEDYWTFLRTIKPMSEYTVFHIPLDLSVQSLLRIHTILDRRTSVGHIHYFTKELALQTLKDLDFEIMDCTFTGAATDLPSRSLLSALAKIPRQFFFELHQDLTVRIFGGYSLLVLTKQTKKNLLA